jgi:hypothetical protein
VGFVVDKVAPGQVFSEYFGFPCQFIPPNSPSSQSPGAINGRRAEWTQFGLHPHYASEKKKWVYSTLMAKRITRTVSFGTPKIYMTFPVAHSTTLSVVEW